MKIEMMPKEVKNYLLRDPAVNVDLPFWCLVSMASSAMLYALQINFYALAVVLPVILFLSLKIKWRFKLDVHYELLIAVIFFVVLFISGRLFSTIQNYSVLRIADYLFYIMALVLFVLMTIKAYKIKSRYEFYAAYLYSLLMIFISTFSVRTLDVQNTILFTVYAIAANFFFLEILPVSYKKAETRQGPSIFRNPYLLFSIPIIVVLSFLFGAFMKKHESTILRRLLEQSDMQGTASFDNKCELGTLENMPQPRNVAVRIRAEVNPVRITGKIYNKYRSGTWEVSSKSISVNQPSETESNKCSVFVEDKKAMIFSPLKQGMLSENLDGNNSQRYTVSLKKNRLLYFPDNAGAFASRNSEFSIDSLGNVTAVSADLEKYELIPLKSGTGIVRYAVNPPTEDEIQIPDDIKEPIRKLTLEVTKNYKTDTEKILAVLRHLQDNHHYQKGISLDRKTDPVLEFLMSSKAAHCEYFASGMALMLRSINIPCRYAAGYIVHEYKRLGGYYVVRGRDAHAWVLVWLPEKGWLVVDPTPASGLPTGNEPEGDDWIEYLSSRIETLIMLIKNGDWKELGREILAIGLSIIRNPVFLVIIAIIVSVILVIKYYRRLIRLFRFIRRKAAQKTNDQSETDQIKGFLERFDGLLLKININRPVNLTLTEYCRYLEEKTVESDIQSACYDFISYYSWLRYSGTVITAQSSEELSTRLDKADRIIAEFLKK